MNAQQRTQIPRTRAMKNTLSAARRIPTAKDKGRVTHTWARWMKLVTNQE